MKKKNYTREELEDAKKLLAAVTVGLGVLAIVSGIIAVLMFIFTQYEEMRNGLICATLFGLGAKYTFSTFNGVKELIRLNDEANKVPWKDPEIIMTSDQIDALMKRASRRGI